MPRSRYAGLFKAAPTPSPLPDQFSISDGASWLHAVAAASARHTVNGGTEGGSHFRIEPAGSQQELEDQIAALKLVFQREEGRPPSDRDDVFWNAVNELQDAYEGPELGDISEVLGGLFVSAEKTLTEQLADLTTAYDDAAIAESEVVYRQRRKRTEAPAAVMAPLIDFEDAISFNRPDATPPDERDDRRRELAEEAFEAVKEQGLSLVPVRTAEGWGLSVTDPRVDADYEVARAAKNAAADALRDFERDHGEEVRAEQRKAEAVAIRDAIAGDDPDAIREAINGGTAAMTSDELAPPPERVTRAD